MLKIDLNSPAFFADPYPLYAKLRSDAPICPLMPGIWLATRYEDANRILRDPRFGKDFLAGVARRYGTDTVKEPAFQTVNRFMLLMNPPEHTRLRTLISKAFGVKQAPELRHLARREANRLVDGFIDQRRTDLIKTFAYPLPVRVICALLDIRLEDSLRFLEDTQALVKVFELSPIGPAEVHAANRAAQAFDDYFRAVCRERRKNPGTDLVSLLLQAEEGEDRLNEDEIIANVALLFLAGHETTANMLGNALLTLFRHPDQLDLLRGNPSLLPQAVTECLRYETSVHIAARVAMQDIAIGAVTIKQGETVYINLGAANRDPAVFSDPDRFLIGRPELPRKPLPFGGGIHYCLGARLARIELETALDILFRKLPKLQLENIDNPCWKPTITIRGLDYLLAHW
ncbi:cytochrome P450 [Methylocaldum sp. 14B]|uniref:cytochrome P450 n=1 Tax=Methylocaldum sp. 14B TaxID=1912213 RepID=UPI00098A97CC|nr:cytochrome P450 [Methylocaldum sp. 14B]